MAVTTITIDLEAYDLLSRHKRDEQSFSQVIKKHFGPQPTAGRFLEHVRSLRVSESALDALEQQVRARHTEPARAAKRTPRSRIRSDRVISGAELARKADDVWPSPRGHTTGRPSP